MQLAELCAIAQIRDQIARALLAEGDPEPIFLRTDGISPFTIEHLRRAHMQSALRVALAIVDHAERSFP